MVQSEGGVGLSPEQVDRIAHMRCPRCGSGSLYLKWAETLTDQGPGRALGQVSCMYCGFGWDPANPTFDRDQPDVRPLIPHRSERWAIDLADSARPTRADRKRALRGVRL